MSMFAGTLRTRWLIVVLAVLVVPPVAAIMTSRLPSILRRGIGLAIVAAVVTTILILVSIDPVIARGDSRTFVSFDVRNRRGGHRMWQPRIEARPGDEVQFVVTVMADGSEAGIARDASVSVQAGPYMRVVPGSVHYIDADQDVVQRDRPLFTAGGIGIRDLYSGAGFHVRFDATIDDRLSQCDVVARTLAFVTTKRLGTREVPVDVTLRDPACSPTTTAG